MKQDKSRAGAASFDERLEDLMMRKRVVKFQLWQLLLLILFSIPAVLTFAALAVKGAESDATALQRFARSAADAPIIAKRVVSDAINRYNPRLARGQRFKGEAGLSLRPGAAPAGMAVLLSRYDGDEKRGVVELLDMDQGKVIHSWRPDVDAINALSKMPEDVVNLKRDYGLRRYVEHHPLALEDGSLVFHGMGSPMVKIDACARVLWTLDGDFHHSTERDADGSFWTVGTIHPPSVPFVDKDFDDDAIAKVSPDGELLLRKSVAQILIDNGFDHIIYSHEEYDEDPIHLNDVQPVMRDGPFWKKGDLFISLRNASMVALYRPSTNAIVWSRQGPWLMQHDIDIISDHEIAVFDNNTVAAPKGGKTAGSNNIVVYDFETDEMREPYAAGFEKNDIRTETNGLFRFFPDGSVMVEEHDYGRLIALDPDGSVRWSYINRAAKDGRVFQLGWSRALSPENAAKVKSALSNSGCEG